MLWQKQKMTKTKRKFTNHSGIKQKNRTKPVLKTKKNEKEKLLSKHFN